MPESTSIYPVAQVEPAERLCERWQEGQRPDLGQFLASIGSRNPAEVLAVLLVDQRHSWEAGERLAAENYLALCPALHADVEYTIQLIYGEFRLREELGETPSLEEYATRFPSYAERLKLQIELHQALASRSEPDKTTATPQRQLGKFQLLRRVGSGAFGAVWRARDTELDRIVAVKIPHANVFTSASDLERFHREARAAAQLRHPGIVTVHEVQTLDGLPVIVSDFIDGMPLTELVKVRPLTFRETAMLVAEVALALDYAHGMGLVHRDIKPANILLGSESRTGTAPTARSAGYPVLGTFLPKIVDFGLALRQEAETTITLEGHIVGTPAYMSPEQAAGKGHQADRRSDIYSLGVVLYELLCGELPFRGSKLMIMQQAMYEEPRPPRRLNDKIPLDLETVCLKAMAKAPARRYGTARELADDLHRFLAGEPIHARPVGRVERCWRWCGRNPVVAALTASAAVFLLAGTAVSSYFAIQANQNAASTQKALAAEAERRRQARDALEMLTSQVIEEWLSRQKELLPEHRKFLEKAVAAYEELARDTGQEEASRAGVALALQRIGNIRSKLWQMAEAERAYRRSHELYQQLAADFPAVPTYRIEQATTDTRLGNLLRDTGRRQDAERAFRDALNQQEQLVADFPSVPGYREDLARSYNNLGHLLQTNGQLQDAESPYRQALKLVQQLAADFPTVPNYRQRLALLSNNLGTLLEEIGQAHNAEVALRNALKVQQQLAIDFPTKPIHREELAITYDNLGRLLTSSGRAQDAAGAIGEARKLFQQLVADFPAVPRYRQHLAKNYRRLGTLLADIGRAEDAEAAYRDAMKLYEQLTAEFATAPDYHSELAVVMFDLANFLRRSKDLDRARQLLEQAVPHHQAALQTNPRNTVYRQFLYNNRLNLAEIFVDLGDHAAAADAAAQLIQAAGDSAEDLYNAACILAHCLTLAEHDPQLSDSQRQEQAEAYAGRALAALRQAVQHGYKDGAHLNKDEDLDPLRRRADFQKLLAEINKR